MRLNLFSADLASIINRKIFAKAKIHRYLLIFSNNRAESQLSPLSHSSTKQIAMTMPSVWISVPDAFSSLIDMVIITQKADNRAILTKSYGCDILYKKGG